MHTDTQTPVARVRKRERSEGCVWGAFSMLVTGKRIEHRKAKITGEIFQKMYAGKFAFDDPFGLTILKAIFISS